VVIKSEPDHSTLFTARLNCGELAPPDMVLSGQPGKSFTMGVSCYIMADDEELLI
jgi:hypothetical protein